MLTSQEMRSKTESELREELKGLKQEQMNLRFQRAYEQLSSPIRMRQVRRQIARVLTILGDKSYKGAK